MSSCNNMDTHLCSDLSPTFPPAHNFAPLSTLAYIGAPFISIDFNFCTCALLMCIRKRGVPIKDMCASQIDLSTCLRLHRSGGVEFEWNVVLVTRERC